MYIPGYRIYLKGHVFFTPVTNREVCGKVTKENAKSKNIIGISFS